MAIQWCIATKTPDADLSLCAASLAQRHELGTSRASELMETVCAVIDSDIYIGAGVPDAEDDGIPSVRADGDDLDGNDDEDGLNNAEVDLMLTEGTNPTVNVIVTNTTGSTTATKKKLHSLA